MLFLVIERFIGGDAGAVGERFRRHGRMLPAGVAYRESWIDAAGRRCYQLMEAPDAAALAPWVAAWDDLVEFEIVPVTGAAEFWAQQPRG